jgi:hypothetical protein
MADLRAIGQVTGDEYTMFTQGGRRLVIRGLENEIHVTPQMADDLLAGNYGRWSGHTHPPGYPMNASTVDRFRIPAGQQRSALWGDDGYTIFHRTPLEDSAFEAERIRSQWRLFYGQE